MSDGSSFPERGGRDHVRTAVEVGVASVPWVGGAGQLLLNTYLPGSLERRREKWFRLLDSRLSDIEESVLGEDRFHTLVIEATRFAMGTHLEAKLELLAGSLQTAAQERADDDFMAMRHLRHVDELEPAHFLVLAVLAEGQILAERDVGGPNLDGVAVAGVSAVVLAPCIRDLASRGLAISEDPSARATIAAPGGSWPITITEEGDELLRFVRYMQ